MTEGVKREVEVLLDTDAMPWGGNRGTSMIELPPKYLNHIWRGGLKLQVNLDPVANYIYRNLDRLKKKNKKLNWE